MFIFENLILIKLLFLFVLSSWWCINTKITGCLIVSWTNFFVLYFIMRMYFSGDLNLRDPFIFWVWKLSLRIYLVCKIILYFRQMFLVLIFWVSFYFVSNGLLNYCSPHLLVNRVKKSVVFSKLRFGFILTWTNNYLFVFWRVLALHNKLSRFKLGNIGVILSWSWKFL